MELLNVKRAAVQQGDLVTGSLEVVSMKRNVITVDLWRAPMHELDYVVLKVDVPEHGLRAGDIGVVIAEPMGDQPYEVEFTSLSGEVIAVLALLRSEIRAARRGEMAHVRQRAWQ
jgi:hypothetical protein